VRAGRDRLRVVDSDQQPTTGEALRDLIVERDQAEAVVRRCDSLIRPLARQWADEKPDGVNRRQFTLPSIDQLRRNLAVPEPKP
jgi:hypothetical protein